ncbi:hypothetical protein [Phreatobacter stygius]|uniref:Uncharacterized protein n=1 Tax=Phreatobacter stygius TaxID=1940610 RepID=A0A4D7BJY0_9HYPH|nr:hypothetical protein [Phreatobacter stygius]QCI68037.1 hypothetical protein E8M01_29705 [Phreatobacter stygius]
MRIFWWGLFGATAGLIVGYVAAVAIGVAAMQYFKVSEHDGGAAMTLLFAVGPLGGLVSALIGAVWAATATRRRMRRRTDGTLGVPKQWNRATRVALGVLIGLTAGYAAARVILQIFYIAQRSSSFATYEAALVAAWIPIALALGCAALGGYLGASRARSI